MCLFSPNQVHHGRSEWCSTPAKDLPRPVIASFHLDAGPDDVIRTCRPASAAAAASPARIGTASPSNRPFGCWWQLASRSQPIPVKNGSSQRVSFSLSFYISGHPLLNWARNRALQTIGTTITTPQIYILNTSGKKEESFFSSIEEGTQHVFFFLVVVALLRP